jgi:D-beta-D-heptose 7-phosphate kinase/D-beta-D-heptose 1-phosphate adenosyltransferase
MKTPPAAAVSWEEAARFASEVRRRGGQVVLTNGVFDLLHPGHVRYLKDARALGDVLIVAVNSDRSVSKLKPGRPINPHTERAEVLAALSCVDVVTIFDEDTPLAVISHIQPDVLVKGADWAADEIVGRDVVEARGGHVARLRLTEGFSTSHLIQRIRTP